MAIHKENSNLRIGHRTGHNTGRTRMPGNQEVMMPINIATGNPAKLQVMKNQNTKAPSMMVPKVAGKFVMRKGK